MKPATSNFTCSCGNISGTAGASDFKFGTQLGFAKAHDEITRRRKGRLGPGLAELPKIRGFPSSLRNGSNLVHNLGLPRPTIKPHSEEKWVWPWAREAFKYFGFPFNISATAVLS